MIERTALIVFFVCMPICAATLLFVVWTGGPDQEDPPIWFFRTIVTTFVIGLASFLVWFVMRMYKNIAD